MPKHELTADERDGMADELAELYEQYCSFLKHPFIRSFCSFCDEKRSETDRIWNHFKPEETVREEQFKRKVYEDLSYGVMFKQAYERAHSAIRRKWDQESARRRDIDNARGL